jgi:hypothetical protein
MARVTNGFLGDAIGKLGNVVLRKWKTTITAAKYQPNVQDANSPAQKKQRSRMVSLLQFLKPLNKNFIRAFNSHYCINSTPWAKAIQDNMPFVAADGTFLLKNLQLGKPENHTIQLSGISYNPFIDQIHISYQPPVLPSQKSSFPYNAVSVLGKYKSEQGAIEFDTRHLLCCNPEGAWYCYLSDEVESGHYLNWWEGGRLWLLLDETDRWKTASNPFHNISVPAYFETEPLIKDFNTNVKVNLVPVDAISWAYKQGSNNWYLDLNIDFQKTKLKNPANFTIKIWGVGFFNNSSTLSGPDEWDLQESQYEVILGENGLQGSAICLYAVYNNKGVQVSCFNRFYINKGTDNVAYPLFDQLFICNYSHPSSFVLSGEQCGFCGNIDNLFGEILALYDQGIIHDGEVPAPPAKVALRLEPHTNGSVEVSGMVSADDQQYFFHENAKAALAPKPAEGFAFTKWDGTDKDAVVDRGDQTFEITMPQDRSLQPVFTANQS